MGGLERALAEQHAIVGQDADRDAVQVREAGDERGAVTRLELVEPRPVHEPGDDLAHVVRGAQVARKDAVDLGGVELRRLRLAQIERRPRHVGAAQVRHDVTRDRERVRIVVGQVVGHARDARVHVAAPQLLGRDLLAGRGLHERGAGEEDRALVLHDHGFVAHCGHVGAARGARAHHHGDLGNQERRHARLVVEDAAEVVAVGEHLGLQRQERATGVDEVHAR